MNDNKIIIQKDRAERNGIELDQHGFPTKKSLEAYHKRNNPPTPHGQRATRLTNQPTTKPN